MIHRIHFSFFTLLLCCACPVLAQEARPVLQIINATQKTEPELPLLHDPGDQWTYSAATRVVGFVLEKISGQTIDVFLRQRIFEPLKMVDTSHAVPADKVSRVITVHNRKDGKLSETPNDPKQESPVRGDGGELIGYEEQTRDGALIRDLAGGEWRPGEALPSEAALARRFRVSIPRCST